MKLTVRIRSGSIEKTLVVEQPHCSIGRSESDVIIDDKRCSRNHALIYEGRGRQLRVKDLGSSNGTTVGDKKITDDLIKVGDELVIGDATLKIMGFEPSEELVDGDSVTFIGTDPSLSSKPKKS